MVAPPVHHFNYTEWSRQSSPWLVVQGALDEVVPESAVLDFAREASLPVLNFPEAGHFFHGQLVMLKARLLEAIRLEITAC